MHIFYIIYLACVLFYFSLGAMSAEDNEFDVISTKIKIKVMEIDLVARICNPSTWEIEEGESQIVRGSIRRPASPKQLCWDTEKSKKIYPHLFCIFITMLLLYGGVQLTQKFFTLFHTLLVSFPLLVIPPSRWPGLPFCSLFLKIDIFV